MEKDDYISGIFREIDEDLKADKIQEVWDKYKNYIIITVISALLITSGVTFWQYRSHQRDISYTNAYYQLLTMPMDPDTIKDGLPFLDNKTGYTYLAELYEAALFVKQENFRDAYDAYHKIAKKTAVPAIYKDLANYYALLSKIRFAKPEEILADINEIDIDDDHYGPLVLELKIFLLQELKRPDEAKVILQELLAIDNLPEGLKRRTELLKVQLSQQ